MNPNTFAKQILFTTVRIIADTSDPNRKSVGTGFIVEKRIDDSTNQFFLVTNKHVIAPTDLKGKIIGKYNKGSFSFIKKEDDKPKLGNSFIVNTESLTELFYQHPNENVDLAICNISNIYNLIKEELKQEIYIRTIPISMIPEDNKEFDAIEDILFVGYPNGIFDQKNHLPIIRRGITASPINIDFDGQKRFIIDAQVFPGSSGSPVFLKENGVISYFFVGIISRVYQRDETGELIESIAPTSPTANSFTIRQAIGLGICEKSHQILELIDLLNKKN